MRTTRALLLVAMGHCASLAAASAPVGAAALNEYSHRLWRIEDGLPQNRIRALCQTPDGYLWIGTAEGLARFDGVRFAIFDQSNTPTLHDDGILALTVGRDGTLWIGTEGGGLVSYKSGAFRAFGPNDGLTNGFVRRVYEDRRQTLWVGTDRGFFRLAGDRFVRLDATPELPLVTVIGLGEDDSGQIWAASSAGLLTVTGNQLHRARTDCAAGTVAGLFESAHGVLWAIGIRGASQIHNGCPGADAALPNVQMRSLTDDSDGNTWIGTVGEGLVRIRDGQMVSFKTASGLPDNTVNAVFEDREENLWIGCEDGLVRLTKRSGTTIGSQEGLEDDDVLTVYLDRQEDLWVATVTGQVYRISGKTAVRHLLPSPAANLRVRTVYQDRKGAYWFGSQGGGLVRQEGGQTTLYTKADGLRSNTVRQILEDRSGTLWIGLDSGLSQFDGHSFHNYYLEDGLSYPSTRSMIVDLRGDVLVGTDAGLNRVHDGRIIRDNEFAALAKEKIWTMYQDSAGTLWLGTRGGGLLRFRSGRMTRFSRDNGLLTNTIFQILDDGKGKFWMSTSAGVISVDRKELDSAADGSVSSIHAIPYGSADGMATSQMNGGFQSAGAAASNGDLWFPTVKGAVRISPSKIPMHRMAPLLIERITADDQLVPLSNGVTIGPGHGRLAIDFTLCELLNPQRVSFRYKLVGFDENWTPALRGRSASYTNLPPGHYQFRVSATDAASSSVAEAGVGLTLRPRFYQTTSFYGLLVLAVGSAVCLGFALYARQTRTRYALLLTERARLAREMHDTVIQGCVGISTLLEAAARFRGLDAAEAEALLAQARAQAANTLEEARQAVWDLRNPEAANSASDMLFDLARKLGSENAIQIETEMVGRGSLDSEIDRAILLVGREALRNAVAHGRPRRIGLRIRFEPSEVYLEVTDNGAGFAIETEESGQNRHFGIVGMRERVEKLHGVISIASSPGKGTKVVARIPLQGRHTNGSTVPQFRAGAR
jgi:ligand-binding sensor domain-containing protein/two-component sensor histidine kinase